jgi:transcription antitermination factor NusG
MNFTIGWYALYVKSRWEKKVYESLKDISLESFLPQIKTIKQWSDRKKTILKPLFPSYVFVNINSSLEFHKALSVNGACAYIRFGKEYARVTEKEINQIKLLIGGKNISDIETNVELPKIGEVKKITYGPLSGLDCEIIESKSHNKIIVRIDSLQQNIVATVPIHAFEGII